MTTHRLAWPLLAACLGCQVVTPISPPPPDSEPPVVAAPPPLPRPAEESLKLATDYLEQGDDASALPHLVRYVSAHPEHLMVRAYLAEAFWRQERFDEAARQFERFIADAQGRTDGEPRKHLIHCHSRLMLIAQAADDAYGEHLHRGIGLYLLARLQSSKEETRDEAVTEGLLCKAAGELTLAYRERPREPRPHWYLYQVWADLGQQHPARRHLRVARAAEFGDLTPAEARELALAPGS